MKEIFKSEQGKKLILDKYSDILLSWPVKNKQYKINTSFGETFIIESGKKSNPPLILLHGSVSNSFSWIGDVSSFSKDFNVFAIDIIGEPGFSAPSRPSYESGSYPIWLNETIKALGLKSCSIIGLSLGGWMALSFSIKYPSKVDNLVLLCPGGIEREYASFLWKAILYTFLGKWGKNQIVKLLNGGKLPDSNLPGLEKALEFTTLISKNFRPRMSKLPLFTQEMLSKLKMPVQIIFGEFDYLIPAKKSIERIKKYVPHVEDFLLPETGHVVTNQSKRIIEFLKKKERI